MVSAETLTGRDPSLSAPAHGSAAATPSSTSRNTPSSSFPMTPDPPSPSNIDRRGLVGVGELATPRWAHTPGPGVNWSQPHAWQDPTGRSEAGPSSWDYSALERNRSWGELATEALGDAQASTAGVTRLGTSESLALGQHARDISTKSAKSTGLGINGQGVAEPESSTRIQPSMLSSYDLKRDRSNQENDPAQVSPLTSMDTASSPFHQHAEFRKTYAAGMLATTEGTTTASSTSPRTHRKRPSEQSNLSQNMATPPASSSKDKNGHDLDSWERRESEVITTPLSAESPKPSPTTPTSVEGRKSRERRHSSSKPSTPSSPGHDIVRQFSASHDFSHLPPSPSSSSIQRFIRQSSVSNLTAAAAATVPAVPAMPNLPQGSLSVTQAPPLPVTPPAEESRRQSTRSTTSPAYPFPKKMDAETIEALRRLDGLGRSPSSATKNSARSGRTRTSSSAADDSNSIRSRPGTPSSSTPERRKSTSWSRSSMPAMPSGPHGLPGDKMDVNLSPRSASFAVTRSSQGGSSSVSSKRGSASSTTTSPYSTAASSNNTAGTRTSVSGPPRLARKNSASSDTSGGLSEAESHRERASSASGREELGDIPPVPPLPKAFEPSSRSSLNPVPLFTQTTQQPSISAAPSSVSENIPPSPSSFVDLSDDVDVPVPSPQTIPSPAREEAPLDHTRRASELAEESYVEPSSLSMSPRRSATKKWSFSSAFNKLSSKHSTTSTEDGSAPMSPTTPAPSTFRKLSNSSSPQIPWTVEENQSSPRTKEHRESVDSYVMPSPPPPEPTERRPSAASSLAPPSASDSARQTPGSSSKRLTPSSIPFFRRSSSTTLNKNASVSSSPRPPLPSTPSSSTSTPRKLSTASTQESAVSSSSGHRKSMLGTMGLTSMLKSSSSRRSLAAAANDESAGEFGTSSQLSKRSREPSSDAGEKSSPGGSRLAGSLGLLGRRRGKVCPASNCTCFAPC